MEACREGRGNHSARNLESPDDTVRPLTFLFPPGHLLGSMNQPPALSSVHIQVIYSQGGGRRGDVLDKVNSWGSQLSGHLSYESLLP